MKRLCLFTWAALLLHACQTTPAKNGNSNKKDTSNLSYTINDTSQWITTVNAENAATALNVLKAYELGDTARLRTYLADTITVYYDGGSYKGNNRELMYAIKEKVKLLKNLHIKVKDCEQATRNDQQQERVITHYTQFYINEQGQPDSADMLDEARFKEGKIVVWYDYVRRYAPPKNLSGREDI